ncbi:glutamate receptor ionotropic, kainate 3-like isoform X3 [Lineus longissimus]|uniref:glutamate receptor ionotropic, kainate 3-like isoform X3 n=1 Tax=Lineus longissimus TaxID=88925 RepID=UPI00315DF382
MKMASMDLVIISLISVVLLETCSSQIVRIGVIAPFNSAWIQAVNGANEETFIKDKNGRFTIEVRHYGYQVPLNLRQVLSLMDKIQREKVTVMVGSYDTLVASMAESLLVPFITLDLHEASMGSQTNPFIFSLYPSGSLVKYVAKDVADYYRWKEVCIIYNIDDGMHLMGSIISGLDLNVKAVFFDRNTSDHDLLHKLVQLRERKRKTMMVLSRTEGLPRVLNAAMKLSLLTREYQWVTLTIDLDRMNMNTWADTGANFTGFRLIRPQHTKSIIQSMDDALSHDAVVILREAVISWLGTLSPETRMQTPYVMGRDILEHLKRVQADGVTGWIQFNSFGRRTNVSLDIVGLSQAGLYKKGEWKESYPTLGERMQTNETTNFRGEPLPFGVSPVRIVTILEEPFIMLKNNYSTGNDRFKGYCIDLLEAMVSLVPKQFEYEIYLVPDGQFGAKNNKGQWTGIMKELIDGNAALAIAPLTITLEREEAIDFTKPFKTLDINILIELPEKGRSLTQFLSPLSIYVWGMVLLALIVVSAVLCAIDRINPDNEGIEGETHRYNIRESLWFCYAGLVGAGTEQTPKRLSARVLGSAWWFFSLIIISSYTANMAAFLTMSQISSPIESIADLGAQNKIKYGTVKNSRAAEFFKNSKSEIYKKMWTQMSEVDPDSMVHSSKEGPEKVHESSYAFLWDSPVNTYTATQDCKAMVLGGPFDRKGYGFGVPKGASYRDMFTIALLKLNEQGTLGDLDRKWWGRGKCGSSETNKVGGKVCTSRWWGQGKCGDPSTVSKVSKTAQLHLNNVGGLFVIMLCAMAVALAVCAAEKCWTLYVARKTNVTSDDMVRACVLQAVSASNWSDRSGFTVSETTIFIDNQMISLHPSMDKASVIYDV